MQFRGQAALAAAEPASAAVRSSLPAPLLRRLLRRATLILAARGLLYPSAESILYHGRSHASASEESQETPALRKSVASAERSVGRTASRDGCILPYGVA